MHWENSHKLKSEMCFFMRFQSFKASFSVSEHSKIFTENLTSSTKLKLVLFPAAGTAQIVFLSEGPFGLKQSREYPLKMIFSKTRRDQIQRGPEVRQTRG